MCQLHGKVVVHLVAIGTVDENGQVEVLVTESIGPAKSKLRHRRTDIGLVIVVNNAIGHTVRTTDILIFHITHPYGIGTVEYTVCRVLGRFRRSLKVLQVLVNTITNKSIEVIK